MNEMTGLLVTDREKIDKGCMDGYADKQGFMGVAVTDMGVGEG